MAPSIITCANCGKPNRITAVPEGVPRCGACHTLLPWLVDADDASFDAEAAASVPVLVDFWAEWCGPCKWVEPIVEQLAHDLAGKLKIVRVDIEAAPAVASRYGVQSIPTLMMLRDAARSTGLSGASSKRHLEEWLARHLGARAGTGS